MATGKKSVAQSPAWVTVGFALLLILLVCSAVTSAINAQRVIENNRWVLHTLFVRQRLSDTVARIVDTESTQRNFLLTGDETYYRDYLQRQSAAETSLEELDKLVSDNPYQVKNSLRLRKLVTEKSKFMDRLIFIRRSDGQSVSADGVRTGVGQQLMQEIKSLIEAMNAEEQRLLTKRTHETESSIWRVEGSFLVGTVLGVVMLTAYFLSLRQFVRDQAESKHETEVALAARIRAEEAEQRVLAELWRSNRELQDFAFVASHDLQEPLRKILAFGDRLKRKSEGRLNADGEEYLERMLSAASRMQKLIDDLLVFSRVTTKARPYTSVDLNVIVREVLETFELRIEALKAEVSVQKLPTIEADAVQMHQLFQNLIGNALKFQKPEQAPKITIASDQAGSNHVISVRDNGIGFDPQFAEKIFTVFQRLHGRAEYEGSGIGLAITRKIVERHGGQIQAQSSPGMGAEFIISLPVNPPKVNQ